LAKPIENARYQSRNAGAHQDEVNAGEHRAEKRRKRRELDLLEIVDADQSVVLSLGKTHLDEIGDDQKLNGLGRDSQMGDRRAQKRLVGLLAVGHEVLIEDAPRDFRIRKTIQRPAKLAVAIAQLQTTDEHGIQPGTRHDPQLARFGHRPSKEPGRDRRAHSPLNDDRVPSLGH